MDMMRPNWIADTTNYNSSGRMTSRQRLRLKDDPRGQSRLAQLCRRDGCDRLLLIATEDWELTWAHQTTLPLLCLLLEEYYTHSRRSAGLSLGSGQALNGYGRRKVRTTAKEIWTHVCVSLLPMCTNHSFDTGCLAGPKRKGEEWRQTRFR